MTAAFHTFFVAAPHDVGVMAFLLAAIGASVTLASADASREDQVKAAYVYQFMRYVTWPPSARPQGGQKLRIGVAEKDELEPLITEAVDGKTIDGHAIEVVRVDTADAGQLNPDYSSYALTSPEAHPASR
jgi:hypothetical protein